jgi:hypothetical protein
MTERRKDLLALLALAGVIVLMFQRILFTGLIIRAPDITNEFIWNIKHFSTASFWDLFNIHLRAGWDLYANGGGTEGGGTLSMQFLLYRSLLFWLIPLPENIAWFIVFHLFFAGAGTYLFCRLIGAGRFAAFLAALVFAVAPENASLINAGHVQKIATISFAPWAFYFLEKGYQTRRVLPFMAASITLAFQFFNMHWQIAYYTCLALGMYGLCRSLAIIAAERTNRASAAWKLAGLNLVVLIFFLTSVSISLLPLADWSKDTTRGVQSGANQGAGGLNVEEAMSWSLPPEEMATFLVPGMFGLSRQEGGYNTAAIKSYYWGRMNFTQTTDYLGVLPWLLLPLALMFRRDKYTLLALAGLILGLLFSMGKFTPFYWFLYEHFPGINHFRVPKMMMIIPALCLGVLGARGLDALMDEAVRSDVRFRWYLWLLGGVSAGILAFWAIVLVGRGFFVDRFIEVLARPTRYEQGLQLVNQRWNNLVNEAGIASAVIAAHVAAILIFVKRLAPIKYLPLVLLCLFLADIWRINDKFMLLQDAPVQATDNKSAVMKFVAKDAPFFRVLPVNNEDPMKYVSQGIPVMYTSNPVQMRRWQDFLSAFVFMSSMPDILNVKYLVFGTAQYDQEKEQLGNKYQPVFQSPDRAHVVLENKSVLAKTWLVPAVAQINDLQQTFSILQNPAFDPRKVAMVESPPPFSMADPDSGVVFAPDSTAVTTYEGEKITVTARAPQNALLVLGEKYYKGWKATTDGKPTEIIPVDHVLRGVYLSPGKHQVEFRFDPLPFKIGKWLTLTSFALFAFVLAREWFLRRGKNVRSEE